MGEWSEADITAGLKEKFDALAILSNKQREDTRSTSKCISQINNLKQIAISTVINSDNTTTITYQHPDNLAGNIMDDTYRNSLISDLIDNIDAYLAKFKG